MNISFRFALPLLFFSIFVAISAMGLYKTLYGQRDPAQIPFILLNKPAPNSPIPLLNQPSKAFQISDYRGKAILVNIFASWCLPCRVEAPALAYLQDSGVTIIGLAYKDRPQDTQKFLQDFGNPFAQVGMDQDGQIGLEWGSYGVPETILVDPDGTIVWRHAGVVDQNIIKNKIMPIMEQY